MTKDDLAEFQSEWVEPISTTYHGYDVFELPPPGQGFAALQMLNILDVCVPRLGANLAKLGPSDPMYWHLMVEAKKLAYSDLYAYNGDPKFAAVPVDKLLSKSYAATLCDRIDLNAASKPRLGGGLDGGTIYLTAADRWGNMVSLIHSVFSVYGSRATVGQFGFVLHNRGSAFSLDPRSPNVVAPRKRPFHTIIAGFVMKDGRPLMTFGNMGGSVQPETHAQHIVNLIDLGMNVQMSTDAARFTHSQTSNVLSLEANLFNRVGAALKTKGHNVRPVNGGAVGGYQGILFTRDPTLPEPTVRLHHERCTGQRRLSRRFRPSEGWSSGWMVSVGARGHCTSIRSVLRSETAEHEAEMKHGANKADTPCVIFTRAIPISKLGAFTAPRLHKEIEMKRSVFVLAGAAAIVAGSILAAHSSLAPNHPQHRWASS